MEWLDVKKMAVTSFRDKKCTEGHLNRLKFEFKEIERQGAEGYWLNTIADGKKFEKNVNGLVLPYLLGITPVDPLAAGIPHKVVYQTEFPDIDIDFIGAARDPVKNFAAKTYGDEFVCSVGTWLTYKPKLAIQDAARALGVGTSDAVALTKELPDEFDEMTKEAALLDFPQLQAFNEEFPEVVDLAYKIVHRIKAQGKHAGGLIISSVPVRDFIPLTICSSQLTSAWTEGRNTQLSKFGFVKFDFLGLKTLLYIWTCQKLIEKGRGIKITWDGMDPVTDCAGEETLADGTRNKIVFTDEAALSLANEVKTESIFQFDTDLAKSIIIKGGVKSFNDLVVYTSLGRPGPLPMVDVYIRRRDGDENWDDGSDIVRILKDTYGIIVFQEQLAATWMKMANFTKPESEEARKAVAKKWVEKLAPIEVKWMRGASRTLGEQQAAEWWQKMVTFGRYAFNKAHATAYSVISYRSLWLKAHYPAEWWAAVMSDCHRERMIRYMGTARLEGVPFGTTDINDLSIKFSVKDGKITPGLLMIKGIGESMVSTLDMAARYTSLDDFMSKQMAKNNAYPSKSLTERLIKLGAFDKLYANRKVLFMWYMYNYGGTTDARDVQRRINFAWSWPVEEVEKERSRQIDEFRKLYPKRGKIPPKILNWTPTTPWTKFEDRGMPNDEQLKTCKSIVCSFEHIEKMHSVDYDLKETLVFEKEYLGFYWHSPMGQYNTEGFTIQEARDRGILECVIEDKEVRQGTNGDYYCLSVTDGVENARVMIWSDAINNNDEKVFEESAGVKMYVTWSDQFRSFNVRSAYQITMLEPKENATRN
jgi:DNA polymerase III alpha subunit